MENLILCAVIFSLIIQLSREPSWGKYTISFRRDGIYYCKNYWGVANNVKYSGSTCWPIIRWRKYKFL